MKLSRRTFLGTAGSAGLTTLCHSLRATESTPLRVALSGCSPQGLSVLRTALAHGGCTPVAFCDADTPCLRAATGELSKASGGAAKPYADFHAMLAAERPQIVIVGSSRACRPEQTISALEAGAHVYVEAPVGPSIAEGRAMVRSARKAGRVVQVGLPNRVSPRNVLARAFLQSGRAGKVGMVRISGNTPDMACPGVHAMDTLLWLTGETVPRRVFSACGRNLAKTGAGVPDTPVFCFEFETFTAVWERSSHNGCICYGTEGMLRQDSCGGWTFYPSDRTRATIRVAPPLAEHDSAGSSALWAGFLRSIRHGEPPVAGIEAGHCATRLSLLGLLSLQTGRAIQWDAERECCVDDGEFRAQPDSQDGKSRKYPQYS